MRNAVEQSRRASLDAMGTTGLAVVVSLVPGFANALITWRLGEVPLGTALWQAMDASAVLAAAVIMLLFLFHARTRLGNLERRNTQLEADASKLRAKFLALLGAVPNKELKGEQRRAFVERLRAAGDRCTVAITYLDTQESAAGPLANHLQDLFREAGWNATLYPQNSGFENIPRLMVAYDRHHQTGLHRELFDAFGIGGFAPTHREFTPEEFKDKTVDIRLWVGDLA